MSERYDPRAERYALQRLLGYDVTEWADGHARVEMPITPDVGNRAGLPHGGVYATLLDTAAGFCGSWRPEGEPNVVSITMALNVNFIAQPKGTRLIATGRRVGGGRKSYFASCELADDLGTLIATAQVTLRYARVDAIVKARAEAVAHG